MRLLDTTTLALTDYPGRKIPPYAILSHTWGNDEVSFQDMLGPTPHLRQGYRKIELSCNAAASDGFGFIWIDTCCIDKTSSSELTEAINSMFRWYEQAEVCYVFMEDVPSEDVPDAEDSRFCGSRWFTRGWTLQELIAPSSMVFFSNKWDEIGTKSSLKEIISRVTGIHSEILLGGDLETFSVAQRMSWASRRETTRVEDIAYCLMGIFGVHMPMLYGEGERAFVRLQEEIMRTSDDQSILAWSNWVPNQGRGLLATSPAAFSQCGTVTHISNPNATPFMSTNRGISLHVPLKSLEDRTHLAVLYCQEMGHSEHLLGIPLGELLGQRNMFVRVKGVPLELIKKEEVMRLESKSIYVREERTFRNPGTPYGRCLIESSGLQANNVRLLEVYPTGWLEPDNTASLNTHSISSPSGLCGAITFQAANGSKFVVVLKTIRQLLSVHVEEVGDEETAQSVFNSLESLDSLGSLGSFDSMDTLDSLDALLYGSNSNRRKWKGQGDRCLEEFSGRKLCVATRKRMVAGVRMHVVDINLTARQEDDEMVDAAE
ncbi:heterokaryon incompatibility protein-domain-containing protein [Tricladium varicosporioides]|nr:heterokaryon incompatibility protein-domain-containing protein [Hymenoscyphus varicosporioides]